MRAGLGANNSSWQSLCPGGCGAVLYGVAGIFGFRPGPRDNRGLAVTVDASCLLVLGWGISPFSLCKKEKVRMLVGLGLDDDDDDDDVR